MGKRLFGRLGRLFGRRRTTEESIAISLGPKAVRRLDGMQARLRVQKRIDVLRRALALLNVVLDHCGDKPFTIVASDGRSIDFPSLAEPRVRLVGGRDFEEA
ncbi:MAG TPA: hypothetical protein VD978_32220 [Azospirillum sp.]|nr:hypothetical protein [Azospirillum sp.]